MKRAVSFRNVCMAVFEKLHLFVKRKCAKVEIVDSSIDAGGGEDDDDDDE